MLDTDYLNIDEEFTALLQLMYHNVIKYGYLQPGLAPSAFEKWWHDQEDVQKFNAYGKEFIPGEVFYLSNESELKQPEYNQLIQIAQKKKHWRLVIKTNNNSYLWKPGDIYVYHKGKTEPGYTLIDTFGKLNVLLMEEYGYRYWLWQPEMSAQQLEEWWQNLETMWDYILSPRNLPGQIFESSGNKIGFLYRELDEEGMHYTAHIHVDDDSYLVSPDDIVFYHKGYYKKHPDSGNHIYL